jgi:serine/threonine protein phosphatase 1
MADKIDSNTTRIYVIGDIHGRLDLLEQMIGEIRRDNDEHQGEGLTVTLGDYVDRGPDSCGVLDCLARNPFATPYVALKGNHEELFENFLRNATFGSDWRRLGGLETLNSYGVSVARLMVGKSYEEAAEQLKAVMPSEHINFLASLRTSLDVGNYFCCHAGIRPGIPFERQSEHDLLWIREEFLNSQIDFGKIVVHGHTPVEQPEVLPNRINVDTGAFATGRLTCVVLEGDRQRFLYANSRSKAGSSGPKYGRFTES